MGFDFVPLNNDEMQSYELEVETIFFFLRLVGLATYAAQSLTNVHNIARIWWRGQESVMAEHEWLIEIASPASDYLSW